VGDAQGSDRTALPACGLLPIATGVIWRIVVARSRAGFASGQRLALSKRSRATGRFAGATGTTTLDAGRPACARVALALDATRRRWSFSAGLLIATPPIINEQLTFR